MSCALADNDNVRNCDTSGECDSKTVIPSVCRVCLGSGSNKENIQFSSLFDPYRDATPSQHINSITNVNIQIEDALPDKICAACLGDLSTVLDFKIRCLNSNESLLNTERKVCINQIEIKLEKYEDEDEIVQLFCPYFDDTERDIYNNNKKTAIKNEWSSILIDSSFYGIKGKKRAAKNELLKIESQREPRGLKKLYECLDCKIIYKSKLLLRVHWKRAHSALAYTCKRCKHMFKSPAAFKKHKNSAPSSCIAIGNAVIQGEGKSRTFGCTKCSYNTPFKNSFRLHMRVHTGEKPVKCKICSKSYTQHSVLSSHMETAHGFYKVEITCEFCGKVVRGRDNAYRHLKQHSSERLQCDICKKFYKSRCSLISHLARHSDVKSFTCDVCASAFYTISELNNHKKFHKEKKDWYKCDLCEFRTPQKRTLQRHKSKHSNSNTPCVLCGKFFVDSMRLLRHMKMHAEGKKFFCQLCEAKYSDRDNLVKHIKKKHKIDTSTAKAEKTVLL